MELRLNLVYPPNIPMSRVRVVVAVCGASLFPLSMPMNSDTF